VHTKSWNAISFSTDLRSKRKSGLRRARDRSVRSLRRLGTSAAQLYRLLDQTNYRKSVDQVSALLQVLNCEVDLVVWTKTPLRLSDHRDARCAISRSRVICRRSVDA
jgi:hypothetical protein